MGLKQTKRIRENSIFFNAAVLKGTAALFYLTIFLQYPKEITKNEIRRNILSVAEIKRLRFFFVVKNHYMTFYHPRAPPSELKFHLTNFKIGGLPMTIKYKFADGSVSEVEVSEEIGIFITEHRQQEENLSRKERYHCISIEGALFKGVELSTNETSENALIKGYDSGKLAKRIVAALDKLTEVQRRRLMMCVNGLTMREIADVEGVKINAVTKSISLARKKFKKFF